MHQAQKVWVIHAISGISSDAKINIMCIRYACAGSCCRPMTQPTLIRPFFFVVCIWKEGFFKSWFKIFTSDISPKVTIPHNADQLGYAGYLPIVLATQLNAIDCFSISQGVLSSTQLQLLAPASNGLPLASSLVKEKPA